MLLFFDTETSGLYNFKKPPADPTQPNLVQLAAILCSDEGKELSVLSQIIYPESWKVSDEAAAVHGITTDRAHDLGVALVSALNIFNRMASVSRRVVAHNLAFDRGLIQTANFRTNRETPEQIDLSKYHFCTMQACTNICKVPFSTPRKFGPQQWKWPKLQEAHVHFFNREFEGAHDALADVRACKDVYFELINRGYITHEGSAKPLGETV